VTASLSRLFPLHAIFSRTPQALRLILVALSCLALHAQSAHWDPAGGELPVGKIDELSLIFEDCSPKDEPQLPEIAGLTLVLRGRSENISLVNLRMSKSITFSYAARLEKKEKAEIPSFEVETDNGKVRVPAVSFKPGQANVGQSSVSIEDVAQAHFQLNTQSVWAGEVFPLTYRLDVLRRYYHQLASHPEWNPAPFVVEEWNKPESTETRKGNETIFSVIYRTRAYAKDTGLVTVNASTQLVNIQTGTIGGFLMSQPRLEQIVITSDQPQLTVKPLPSPAPATFNGAVGQFKFVSKVVPEKTRVGEPVTWTLELSGVGNWPDVSGLPTRSVSKAFQVIQPQAKRTLGENKLFEGVLTEDAVLMPTKAGTYALGPVSFSYFDPKTGAYKTITTEKLMVTIEEASASPFSTAAAKPAAPAEVSKTPAGEEFAKPQPTPSAPVPLPADPLSSGSAASTPLSPSALLVLLLLPLLLVLGFWGSLALNRTRAADPAHPRRLAARRLRERLRKIAESSSPDVLRSALLSWQHDAALTLGLFHAAPTADAIERQPGVKQAGDWARLWREADQVLYSSAESLPADWHSRAVSLSRGAKTPSFPWYKIFAPRNLLPWWFAALALILFVQPFQLRAATTDEGAESYAAARFDEAAAYWKSDLGKHPLDWRTRHNLALALLQQGKHGEAVAHLAASFVQQPRNESVRRSFLVAMNHAGFSPQEVGDLAQDRPSSELARLATPFGWQLILVASCLFFGLGLLLALNLGYGLHQHWVKIASILLLVVSLLTAGASVFSLRCFGLAADREAVLVWQSTVLRSVPTEVDSSQKTSALPAGSLAVVEKNFYGWNRLRFADGETGWVRAEDTLALWH
jgi:hypothetical protein